jgi:tRNA threonylcarbamoyladenosine biosynthesis protein TsaB
MKILGIDTSTPCGSVGLVDGDRVLGDYLLNSPVTHSERLIEAIELILRESHLSANALDGWAVSLGPGSFTGLRIGVSTVKGLSFATGTPVLGVPTLDILAHQAAPVPYQICPVLDARKKEVYTAFYRYGEGDILGRRSPFLAVRPETLIEKIKEKTLFVGEGLKTYGSLLKEGLPNLAVFGPSFINVPHGSVVAQLGLELLRRGETLDPATFGPIYIRPSEAEIKWREKHPDERRPD